MRFDTGQNDFNIVWSFMDFISRQTFDFFRLSGNSASWNEVSIILVRYVDNASDCSFTSAVGNGSKLHVLVGVSFISCCAFPHPTIQSF